MTFTSPWRAGAAMMLMLAFAGCKTAQDVPFGVMLDTAKDAQRIDANSPATQPVTGVEGERSFDRYIKSDAKAEGGIMAGASSQPQ